MELLVKAHSFAKEEVEKKGYEVLLSGYVGSQHLQLTDEMSDYDFVFYVMPKKEDVYMGKVVNKEYQLSDLVGVKVLSWLSVGTQLNKVTFNLFEVLADTLYVDDKVVKEVEGMKSRLESIEGYKRKLEKNVYFMGNRSLRLSQSEPGEGSREMHYVGGVDYKSLAKAWLYYRILEEGLDLWNLYEGNVLPEDIEREVREIRQKQEFSKWEVLEDFYGKETAKGYIERGIVDRKVFKGDSLMLAEPLKYVFN